AKCSTASTPWSRQASSTASASRTSPATTYNCPGRAMVRSASQAPRCPAEKSSYTTTSRPAASRAFTAWLPMYPAPPVTRIAMSATDRHVGEAVPPHGLRRVDVAAIHDERLAHQLLHALEVGLAELVPFRDQGQRVGPRQRLVALRRIRDPVAEDPPGRFGGLGIEGLDAGAPGQQSLDDRAGRRLAHVVGARLEGEA